MTVDRWPIRPFPSYPELDTEWMAEATCRRRATLPWLEDRPERVSPLNLRRMAAACASCPVFDFCEAFVDEAGVTAGFWAGKVRQDEEDQAPDGWAA